MVRTYWFVPVFNEASGNLDLQPDRTDDQVESNFGPVAELARKAEDWGLRRPPCAAGSVSGPTTSSSPVTEPGQPCVMISGNVVGLATQMAGRCRRAAGVLASGSSLDGVRSRIGNRDTAFRRDDWSV